LASITKRLYRAAERYPPADREYRTSADRGRVLPSDASEEQRRSWDALSAWETEEAAMAVACGSMSARFVVSFDIPEVCFGAQDACRITCEPSGEPGHFDIRGDMEELKRYLSDVRVDVERRNRR
jgi:hypothetical protein